MNPFLPLPLLAAVVFSFGCFLPEPICADEKSKLMRQGRMKMMACAACHGMSGQGSERDGQLLAPAYDQSVIVRNDPEMMALILLKGIDLAGSGYPVAMNGFEQVYDDGDLAAVMTFIRNRWGGHDDFVSETQVGEWRQKYAERNAPVSQAELAETRNAVAP